MERTFVALIALVLSSYGAIVIAQHQIDCVAAETVRVWTPITPAVVKTRVEPAWPAHLRYVRVQGTVFADVWIDQEGNVTCVKITQSMPLIDFAVSTAVHKWKFTPAMLGDKTVAVVQQVQVPYLPLR